MSELTTPQRIEQEIDELIEGFLPLCDEPIIDTMMKGRRRLIRKKLNSILLQLQDEQKELCVKSITEWDFKSQVKNAPLAYEPNKETKMSDKEETKYMPIIWVSDNPTIDGAKYFDSMEDAIEFIDRHFIKASNVVKWTICEISKGSLNPNSKEEA